MNSNIPILSNQDFYYINPDFLIFNNILETNNLNSYENFDNTSHSSDFPKKFENQSEKMTNNEAAIHFSFADSSKDNISGQSKTIEKNIPQIEKIYEVDNSNEPIIFPKGIYDNYSNQIIYEALNETKKNSNKPKKTVRKIFTNYPKISRRKKKNIEKRKDNTDNIRRKIKSHFIKRLIKEINKKLKNAGSKYIFKLLPQPFVCNLSKKLNRLTLDLTLKEIFMKNFCNGNKVKKADLNKYKHNLFVLNYLENNQTICEKSNFNKIKNMKYSQIFNEYLSSNEFGLEITTLKIKESDKYIKNYIVKARNLLDFFLNRIN